MTLLLTRPKAPSYDRLLYLGALTGVVIAAAPSLGWWQRDAVAAEPIPNPEDGRMVGTSYTNPYFGLSYPLPGDWKEGLQGPSPSRTGYYVLDTFVPKGEPTGNVLVAARDSLFADKSMRDAAAMTRTLSQSLASHGSMKVDHEPSEMTIAGHVFSRVDYSGIGLYHATFATDVRCHIVSFNLTARDPGQLASLAKDLDRLDFPVRPEDGLSVPLCVRDYVVAENIVHQVALEEAGPKFVPIPVRLIIGTDGHVKHVHVISASNLQRRSIEEALSQWEFKPYKTDQHAVEIETGIVFNFKHGDS
jgi:hypothetical protein